MSEKKDYEDQSRIDRRDLLKATGAIGIGAAIFPETVAAEDQDWEKVGSVVFSEAGFTITGREPHSHIDQVPTYEIDKTSNDLRFYMIRQDSEALLDDSNHVVKTRGFHSLPHVMNNGNSGLMVPVSTNGQKDTFGMTTLDSEIKFPAVQIKPAENNSIRLRHKGNKKVIEPGAERSLRINVKNRQEKFEYTVENHGEVDVYKMVN